MSFYVIFLVVYRNTKLFPREISKMSLVVGMNWNNLAALMDIPYSKREEIRQDHINYPNATLKAEKIFKCFNESSHFCRYVVEKSIEELHLHEVKAQMLARSDQVFLINPISLMISLLLNTFLATTPIICYPDTNCSLFITTAKCSLYVGVNEDES